MNSASASVGDVSASEAGKTVIETDTDTADHLAEALLRKPRAAGSGQKVGCETDASNVRQTIGCDKTNAAQLK